MSDILASIGVCPTPELPVSMEEQKCLDITKHIRRLVFFNLDQGTDPFNDDGMGAPLADAAALKASLETEATWDAAIAALPSSFSNVVLTPKIQNADRPLVNPEPVERPDGSRIMPSIFPSSVGTYTLEGLSSANHEALMSMMGSGLGVMFIDQVGKTIYKRLTDGQVAQGDVPWFVTETMIVSTRGVTTGNDTPDAVNIQLSFAYDELVKYVFADTEGFLLSK